MMVTFIDEHREADGALSICRQLPRRKVWPQMIRGRCHRGALRGGAPDGRDGPSRHGSRPKVQDDDPGQSRRASGPRHAQLHGGPTEPALGRGPRLRRDLAQGAPEQALQDRTTREDLIHHSDRGVQLGFKEPSQHLNNEDTRWRNEGSEHRITYYAHPCSHPAGHRPAGASTDSGSGVASARGCRVRDARMGRLVQQPPAPRADREHSARRVRGDVRSDPRESDHGGRTQLTESPENPVQDAVTQTRALQSFRFAFDRDHPNDVLPFNPATGEFNPIAQKLQMAVDGNKLLTHGEFSSCYESGPDTVQGGRVAAVYDQLRAYAVMAGGRTGPTLWLKVST